MEHNEPLVQHLQMAIADAGGVGNTAPNSAKVKPGFLSSLQ